MTPGRHQLEIQDRDVALLRGLFESRLMTLSQATQLHFDGHPEAAKKRLQKLKAAGAVRERPRRPYEPSILFLTRKGFSALSERGAIATYPSIGWRSLQKRVRVSPQTLHHELDVMTIKAAMVSALANSASHEIVEFSTWPKLFQFPAARSDPHTGRQRVTVKPDGFIRIGERASEREHRFFLEVDRSTETQQRLALQATCYRDYYRSGGLAARFGAVRTDYEAFPFRVLMVFPNAERRNNTAERLLQLTPPIAQQVWLSTFPETTVDPLGAVWLRPRDYLEVTKGTAFDPARGRENVYRRQPERDEMVEKSVKKLRLLCPP